MLLIRVFFIIFLSFHLTSAKFDEFNLNLYKTIVKSNLNENLMISPASVAIALGLTSHGASGQTKAQIQQTLGDSDFSTLSSQIKNDYTIESAAKIFIAQKFSLKSNYQRVVSEIYGSKAERVNFNEKEKTAEIINKWTSERTRGLIDKIIEADSIKPDDAAVIVNAMFFNGTWEKKFINEPDFKLNFHVTPSKVIEVPRLYQNLYRSFDYAELPNDKLKVVRLPYKDTNIEMIILLPDEVDGLQEIERKMTKEKLNSILSATRREEKVKVTMPKFKIENSFKLKESLKEIGIERMFERHAEFDNLINEKKDLKVKEVVHKTTIDVNEVGTVAAAATRVMIGVGMSRDPSKKINFIVDRPFLFLIKNPDFTFFIGRVVEPKY